MIRKWPFITNEKNTFFHTVTVLLNFKKSKENLKISRKQFALSKYKRKKKWDLMRRHQWRPQTSYVGLWARTYARDCGFCRARLLFVMTLPVPVASRIHQYMEKVRRDNEVFYAFLNENFYRTNFTPWRLLKGNGYDRYRNPQGIKKIGSLPIYTVYTEELWEENKTWLEYGNIFDNLKKSELIPMATMYDLNTCFLFDARLDLTDSVETQIFDLFFSVNLNFVLEIYKITAVCMLSQICASSEKIKSKGCLIHVSTLSDNARFDRITKQKKNN